MTLSVPAPRRRTELEELFKIVQDADGGGHRAAILCGPPGVGAGSLLDELERRIEAQGGVVLAGTCDDPAGGAYRGFRAVVASAVRQLDALGEGRLLAPLVAAFGIESELPSGLLAAGPLLQRDARINLFEAVRSTLQALAASRSAVVVLRAAHLADGDTLDLIEYLLTDPAGGAALPSIVSGSPTAVRLVVELASASSDGDGEAFARLSALGGAHVVRLTGLEREDVAAWLASDEVVDRVIAVTGGAPDRIRLLLDTLPEDLDAMAHRHLLDLPDEATAVLQALVVADGLLSGADLLTVCGLTEMDVARALGQLRRGNLVERNERGRLRLCEHVPRDWLTGRITAERRVTLHRAVGENLASRWALDRDDALLIDAARHFIVAGERDRAVAYGLQAGAVLKSRMSFHAARALYQELLTLGPEPGTEQTIRLRLAESASAAGREEEARTEIERVLSSCDPGEDLLPLLVRLGELQSATGQLDAAIETLQRALSAETAARHAAQSRHAGAVLAETLRLRGDLPRAEELCQELLLTATQELRAEVLVTLGNVHLTQGRTAAARRSYEQAVAASSDGAGSAQARAQLNLGLIALREARYTAAVQKLQESLGLCELRGEFFGAALAHLNLGVAYEFLERYALAERFYLRAIDLFARLGRTRILANALVSLADLYIVFGSPRRGQRLLRRALPLATQGGMTRVAALARQKMGLAETELCRFSRALPWFAEAAEALRDAGAEADLAWTLAYHARAALLAGRRDVVARCLEELTDVMPDPAHEASAIGLLVEAAALLEDGQPREAAIVAADADEVFAQLAQRAWRVEAQLLIGRCREASGDTTGAKLAWEGAAELLGDLKEMVPLAGRERFLRRPAFRALSDALARTDARIEEPTGSDLEPAPLAGPVPEAHPLVKGLIGSSPSIRKALEMVDRVALSGAPVVLLGESGTGKELVAEAIHRLSERSGKPFVRVNSAAFAETLLESELFGHEKGAFTGAMARREGKFELADGGTLFLDEIGDISPKTQVSLLRVLQEGELVRVGGSKPVRVDVRLICATNRDLSAMVREGRFRLDLYYRIRGFTLELPALRDRDGDVALLANHFLLEQSRGPASLRLSAAALRLLESHPWPGNVRELENVLHSASLFAEDGVVQAEHVERFLETTQDVCAAPLPALARQDGVSGDAASAAGDAITFDAEFSLDEARRQMEVRYIMLALEQTDGNITKAAELLKMTRPRLSQKIKEYEIPIRGVLDRRTR